MIRRTRIAITGYFGLLVGIYAFSTADDLWRRHVEATHPVYAPVERAAVLKGSDWLTWTGVSRKLQPCAVIPGSAVTLTGHWRDKAGNLNPRAYPAERPSGKRVAGAPIVQEGDGFVVGPWIIRDTPEAIAGMTTVSSFVHCRFPDGVERFAEIGPVEVK